jgi:predicted transcriptional regulator
VQSQAARRSALKHLTDKLFQGSTELLFTHLVSDQKLTAEQIERMRRLLDRKADGEEKP